MSSNIEKNENKIYSNEEEQIEDGQNHYIEENEFLPLQVENYLKVIEYNII